jgi:alanine-glyoxylate transaminase / serine-glyoxylate transaminase / serine-pyruvate transaminase
MTESLLMIPGPTNISERVREVMSRPQQGHGSQEFTEKFGEMLKLARLAFKNDNGSQFAFTGSGTLAMEASVVSTVQPGDKVLVLDTGYFGQRMVSINEAHSAQVVQLQYPIGTHANPDDLRGKLREGNFRAVFITHVDTGSAVVNPIKELVAECKNAGAFAVVDSVCGIAGEELDFDRLGADVVFTASQKAIAAPPGVVLIAVSNELLGYFQKRAKPIEGWYLNLLRWKPIMDDPKVYLATPAVQIMLALREALLELKEEGLEERWKRHTVLAEKIRESLQRMDIEFVAEEGYRANTLTGFIVKEGKAQEVQKELRDVHKIEVARGLGDYNGKMIRIGHMGILNAEQTDRTVKAVWETLAKFGLAAPIPAQSGRQRI